ncbi:hypothetical protein NDN13_01380 [Acinetobacter sp. C32I]|uniref:hypothetical protein n=1 Tax=Acinetobacter TaxID=469 RepID=UPI00203669E1|nr:hypothetical protein [Acinetobacter sp. C32I]USA53872.1 hypothetical protein NDN13_01380 [Acinetobacter sp. C32I]
MRKTGTVLIDQDNRDKGKKFLITEMSAYQAEAWATRALLALTNAGAEIPDNVAEMGLAGIANVGFSALSKLQYDDAKPLLDELMDCVQIIMPAITRPLIHGDDGDIEEISTYMKLKKEAFMLHVNFSKAEKAPISE